MKMLTSTTALTTSTAIAVLALGTGVASAHTTRFGSDVSIGHGVNPMTGVSTFHGNVTSERAGCEPQRRVSVFRMQAGADQPIGSDRTDAAGAWSFSISDPPDGDYYARVKRRDIGPAGHNHICRGARSETIFVS